MENCRITTTKKKKKKQKPLKMMLIIELSRGYVDFTPQFVVYICLKTSIIRIILIVIAIRSKSSDVVVPRQRPFLPKLARLAGPISKTYS